jgi:hypothetical protein
MNETIRSIIKQLIHTLQLEFEDHTNWYQIQSLPCY